MDKNEDRQQLGRTAIWTGSNMNRQTHGWMHIHMSTEGYKDERTDGHKGQKLWIDGYVDGRDVPSKKALSMFLNEENLL